MNGMHPTSPRANLVVALIGVAIGSVLLFAALLQGNALKRITNAPICADEQIFTASHCRAEVDGTVVALSNGRVDLTVDGRPVAMRIQIAGETSGNEGAEVRVTFYNGKPIHIEGSELFIDGADAPATKSWNLRNFGLFFLIAVPVLAGGNVLIGLARRD